MYRNMVNPGSFGDAQKIWIEAQRSGYAKAISAGTEGNYTKDVLRRYFLYFAVERESRYQPSAEEMKSVNVDAAVPEVIMPEPEANESLEEYQAKMDKYTIYTKTLVYRMGVSPAFKLLSESKSDVRNQQVVRRLSYIHRKATMEAIAKKKDLFALLMKKLAGVTTDNPRKKSAFDTWANANPEVRDAAKVKVREAKIPGRQRGAARQTAVREAFAALPEDERNEWEIESLRVQTEALIEHQRELDAAPSEDPEDRQRSVSFSGVVFSHSPSS